MTIITFSLEVGALSIFLMDVVPFLWKLQLLVRARTFGWWLSRNGSWSRSWCSSGPKPCSWLAAWALLQLLQVSHRDFTKWQRSMWTTEELLLFAFLLGWPKFLRKSYNLLHVLQEEFHSRNKKKTLLCNRHHDIYHTRGYENRLKWYSSKSLRFLVLLFLE